MTGESQNEIGLSSFAKMIYFHGRLIIPAGGWSSSVTPQRSGIVLPEFGGTSGETKGTEQNSTRGVWGGETAVARLQ